MIATPSSDFDVFISQATQNRAVGDAVAEALHSAGVSVRLDRDFFVPGKGWESALRKALVESDAFVVILDPAQPVSPNSTFELGAVAALGKPVFVVVTGRPEAMPQYLRRYPTFTVDSLEALAGAIRKACEPLSADQRNLLMRVYQQLGVPSDRLLSDPLAMETLGEQFRKSTGEGVRDGQLASELLRLRKTGRLPRLRAMKKS